MKKVLYISLTGMTEALGESQVLEYLIELSKNNKIFLISFEREYKENDLARIKEITSKYNISWNYFQYSNKYGIFSSLSQILKVLFEGKKIIKNNNIQILHARSFIPGLIGGILKYFYDLKLVYDIRGFSIDEKLDRGRLKEHSVLFKVLKNIDNYLYKKSDHIVTLTHKAKEIIIDSLNIDKNMITVIPTCANKKLFTILKKDENKKFKDDLGFWEKDIIFIHTGTVSGWYDFDSELLIMKKLMEYNENIKLLILNKNEKDFIDNSLTKYDINREKVLITSSDFSNVYKYLNISDYAIFFIKPSFSKQASAPTKFAENIACFLPSITNKNVGDMEYYINKYETGILFDLNDFNVDTIAAKVIKDLDKQYSKELFDELFNEHFDKKNAIIKYEKIYKELI